MRRTLLLLLCAAFIATAASPICAQSNKRDRKDLLDRLRDEETIGKTLPDNSVVLGKGPGDAEWSFPERENQWLNSGPLKGESLLGKGILMLFFEEECPTCAKQWPEMLRLSKEYSDQPIVFIAVNSGSAPRAVSNYVRRAGITWPVIVDYDRTFENEMGVSTISLDNIVQVRYVSADGVNRPGKWSDIPATVEEALKDATWKVEPNTIPNELKTQWRAIEFGDYTSAAKKILRYVNGKKESTKIAAESLLEAVNEAMEVDMDIVRDALREDKQWEAYKGLKLVKERFKGYEIPEVVDAKLKELAENDSVKAEIEAKKTLDKALATAAKNSSSAKKRARTMLERLISTSPDTEAATKAEDLLAGAKR